MTMTFLWRRRSRRLEGTDISLYTGLYSNLMSIWNKPYTLSLCSLIINYIYIIQWNILNSFKTEYNRSCNLNVLINMFLYRVRFRLFMFQLQIMCPSEVGRYRKWLWLSRSSVILLKCVVLGDIGHDPFPQGSDSAGVSVSGLTNVF